MLRDGGGGGALAGGPDGVAVAGARGLSSARAGGGSGALAGSLEGASDKPASALRALAGSPCPGSAIASLL